MPLQLATSVENNFTKGLITQSIGLDFPENAATDTDNCEYTLVGEVLRRLGIDREVNGSNQLIDRTGIGVNAYKWNNAGGDGTTQLVVVQMGRNVVFYNVTASTISSPLSQHLLAGSVDLPNYAVTTFDSSQVAEFADGNGYLFIFHPNCDPVYVTYNSGVISSSKITIQIRDLAGIAEPGVDDNTRPSSLTDIHKYNLQNQGWVSGNPWSTTSTSSVSVGLGAKVFTVPSGLPITAGQTAVAGDIDSFSKGVGYRGTVRGTVTSYVGTTLTLSITYITGSGTYNNWSIVPIVVSQLTTWNTAIGNYPSNADQWWRFKNSNDIYDPGTTQSSTSIGLGSAPKGHYILNAFNQIRSALSGISNLTDIVTTKRPTHGCWFQGRVWYSGVNASQAATGTAPFYTWSENIYFSQVIQKTDDFGKCYQTNDATSQELFDLLPTDGGVIVIQGCGPVYKLFPTQNGLLVFAGNGVWFITGSQGIGFSANDYTITKISSVQSISSTSFVDVLGLPYFWNEEGIYKVTVTQNGSLSVDAITHTTILNFYSDIPLASKKFVRGAYDPIEYMIQWVYRSTDASDTTQAYTFDRALNYSTANQAFFPYTFDNTKASISSILYVSGVGGSTTLPPMFKYISSPATPSVFTFSDLHDEDYVDWAYLGGANYVSYFVTGYKIRGQAIKKFQPQYVQVWSNVNNVDSGYKIQGVWDYAINRNSNRYSGIQLANFDATSDFKVKYKRHKIRGYGYALQFKIISQDGLPFDVIGWGVIDTVNQSA